MNNTDKAWVITHEFKKNGINYTIKTKEICEDIFYNASSMRFTFEIKAADGSRAFIYDSFNEAFVSLMGQLRVQQREQSIKIKDNMDHFKDISNQFRKARNDNSSKK